jgi:Ca2+-binding EF-hand superfamily protein
MATSGPSGERMSELREDFEQLDEDHDGLMEFGEFVHFMDGLGADMTNEECRVGFAEIDSNRDGRIEFREFLDWWTSP